MVNCVGKYFITDDFGNQWIINSSNGIRRYYPAPTVHLKDTLHDEWGCWALPNKPTDFLLSAPIRNHYYFVAAEFSYGCPGHHNRLKTTYEVENFIAKQRKVWKNLPENFERPRNFVLLEVTKEIPF